MIQPLKTDWPAIAPDVVRTFLGPPNPDASSRKELRWGKRGSFALTLDSGRWRDYESGRSGGVLDLVERETGADRAGALEWLKSRGFLEIDRKGLHQRPIQPLSAGRTRDKHHLPPHSRQQPPPCGGARHFLAAGRVPRSPFPTTSTTRRADG